MNQLAAVWERARQELLNPIFMKELRSACRSSWMFVMHFLLLGIVTLYVVTFLTAVSGWDSGADFESSGVSSKGILQGAVILQLAFIGLVLPLVSSVSFTLEKERNTLEPLLLSGLTPGQIVWGKLLASVYHAVLALFLIAPVLAPLVALGGVAPWQIITSFVFLLIFAAWVAAFGVMISTMIPRTVTSVFCTFILLAFVIPYAAAGIVAVSAAVGLEDVLGQLVMFEAMQTSDMAEVGAGTIALAVAIPLFLSVATIPLLLLLATEVVRPPTVTTRIGLRMYYFFVAGVGTAILGLFGGRSATMLHFADGLAKGTYPLIGLVVLGGLFGVEDAVNVLNRRADRATLFSFFSRERVSGVRFSVLTHTLFGVVFAAAVGLAAWGGMERSWALLVLVALVGGWSYGLTALATWISSGARREGGTGMLYLLAVLLALLLSLVPLMIFGFSTLPAFFNATVGRLYPGDVVRSTASLLFDGTADVLEHLWPAVVHVGLGLGLGAFFHRASEHRWAAMRRAAERPPGAEPAAP